ncbi:MAG: hemerythrin domain-containing protein [Phycisphaerales bacterium]|nr:hemerythrin domain-containing protein [Phycisphaerales bacterium]
MDNDTLTSSEPPLKRHPTLQPLSREHMSGLIQARNLQRAAGGDAHQRRVAVEAFTRVWHKEIRSHFDDEERLLLPLTDCPELRSRLLAEHGALRELAEQCAREPEASASDETMLRRLGGLLHDHIRWEERVYFESIQRDHPEELARLLHEADRIERLRPGARPRHTLGSSTGSGQDKERADEH